MLDLGLPNRRVVVTERPEGWWNTAIAMSAAGFLRVTTVHRMPLKLLRRWRKRAKEIADGRP